MSNLPSVRRVGETGRWELPVDVDDETEEIVTIEGVFIGMGTSHTGFHRHHRGNYAAKNERCGACRWFETRLFKLTDGDYVLYHVGATIVPGELVFHRMGRARSAYEVVEMYTDRARDGTVTMTKPAARALSQGAGFDAALRDAYVDRAVS